MHYLANSSTAQTLSVPVVASILAVVSLCLHKNNQRQGLSSLIVCPVHLLCDAAVPTQSFHAIPFLPSFHHCFPYIEDVSTTSLGLPAYPKSFMC